jgi:hypothetical protein
MALNSDNNPIKFFQVFLWVVWILALVVVFTFDVCCWLTLSLSWVSPVVSSVAFEKAVWETMLAATVAETKQGQEMRPGSCAHFLSFSGARSHSEEINLGSIHVSIRAAPYNE